MVASDLPGLGKSLVGYVTPVDGAGHDTVDLERIRARVAAALPEYMTPAAYVVIDEIPITAHGKIDRAALPEPEIMAKAQYRDPSTGTERRIAALFSELLGHDRVGVDDSFFDLGGHSLVATKLVTAIRSECGVELGIRDVFELGTVGSLAERVDDLRAGTRGQARPKLVATTHDEPLPLSASQLRSWFAFRVDGPSPVNNIPFAARLTGPWDIDALIAAVGDVVARHEILRTTYVDDDGIPYQVVGPVAELTVRRATGDGERWLQEQLGAERRHCFELDREWPIRVAVLDTGDTGEHVLSLVVHHIASDHWSAGVLFADVMTAYRARRDDEAPSWAPLRIQYADYAAWQREFLGEPGGQESAVAADQRAYWTGQLAGLPEDSGLRPDFPRPPLPSGDGESVTFSIGAATRVKLAERCRELGVTEFMALQAAVAVVLHKAGSGVDIPLGTPVAGRSEAELDQLIGFFVNILVLRNDLTGNPTLRDVLTRARETALAAYAHQDLPFDRVVDSVSPVRSLSRNPLFQVIVHVRDHLPATRIIESSTATRGGHGMHVAGPGVRHGARRSERQLLRHRRVRRDRLQRAPHLPHRIVRAEHHRTGGRLADPGRHRVRRRHQIRVCAMSVSPMPTRGNNESWTAGAEAQRRSTSSTICCNPSRSASSATSTYAGCRAGSISLVCAAAGERARWTEDGRLEVSRTRHRWTHNLERRPRRCDRNRRAPRHRARVWQRCSADVARRRRGRPL